MALVTRFGLDDILGSEVIDWAVLDANQRILGDNAAHLHLPNTYDGGVQVISGATPTEDAIAVRVDGDITYRYLVDSDGTMAWGPGTAAGQDVSLYRSALGTLATDGDLAVLGGDVRFGVGDADTSPGRLWWDGAADIIGLGFDGGQPGSINLFSGGTGNPATWTLDPVGNVGILGSMTVPTGAGLQTAGAATDVILVRPGGLTALSVSGVAAAINWLQVIGAATGSSVILRAAGTGTDANGSFLFQGRQNAVQSNYLQIIGSGAAATVVNSLIVRPSATGIAVGLEVTGSDANIGLSLLPKGTGVVTVPTGGITVTAGGIRITGNSTIAGSLAGLTALTMNASTVINTPSSYLVVGPAADLYLRAGSGAVHIADSPVLPTAIGGSLSIGGALTGVTTLSASSTISTSGGISVGASNSITTPASYLIIQPAGDLYLRTGAGGTIRMDSSTGGLTLSGPISGVTNITGSGALNMTGNLITSGNVTFNGAFTIPAGNVLAVGGTVVADWLVVLNGGVYRIALKQ
jgi:hypothetical protein